MLKDLIKQSKMSEEEILEQLQEEHDIGYSFAEPIWKDFDEETKLFNYQKKNKDEVWDSTLFNVHSAMMAREYVDKPTSKFDGSYGVQNVIKNLNTALEADFADTYMENCIYDWKHDKFLRGLGIMVRNGWDATHLRPTYEVIDPRQVILDPDGDYRQGKYGFFGFYKDEYKKTLDKQGVDTSFVNKKTGTRTIEVKTEDQKNAWLADSRNDSKNNPVIATYYHFTTFNGVKALVCTANDRTMIIKVKIYTENKEVRAFDDILAITYWKPRKNNPFGDRMARYIGDVQIIKSMLASLRLKKVTAELYPMYIRNTRLIKNKADLDFWFNKIVDANPLEWESLQNALTPIQRDTKANDSYVLDDSLDKQVEASVSIGKIAQGTAPERREAATTNKLIQDNTDINLAFTAKIDALGYEKLIMTWYFGIKEKFKTGDKKLVYLQTGAFSMQRELTRKDLVTDMSLKIVIETRIEIEEQKQKDRLVYQQMIAYLQTIPNRPESAQLNTLRNYARSMDMREDLIEMEIPPTVQELIAQENTKLLMDWEYLEVDPSYDPDTHLISIAPLGNEMENVAVYRYMLTRLKQIKPQQQQEQQNESMSNNLVAQAGASALNEANTNTL